MITQKLQQKIDASIRLLKSYDNPNNILEIAYSGGKDSDVILQLAKEAGIHYRAIYRNTTIDPIGTLAHVRSKGVEVLNPKKSFFKLVSEKGYPPRKGRFCCEELKEYKVLDRCAMGVRKTESKRRDEQHDEPTSCRLYTDGSCVDSVYPILYWTDEDISNYIEDRKIQCHPLYYDEQGKFHVERRLGCVGCPLQSRRKKLVELKNNPKITKAWIRFGQRHIESHPNTMAAKRFGNAFNFFYFVTSCDSLNEYYEDGDTPFGKRDCKKLLEDYFKIDLSDVIKDNKS